MDRVSVFGQKVVGSTPTFPTKKLGELTQKEVRPGRHTALILALTDSLTCPMETEAVGSNPTLATVVRRDSSDG